MTETIHLVIEGGTDTGRQLSIPGGGARLGRSSKNDIVLLDPLLSRYHCRFFFKPEEGLWVADLGSANQTLVNDHPVQEARLRVGDAVMVGDTTLRVVADTVSGVPGTTSAMEPIVDLGLQPAPAAPRRSALNTQVLIAVASVVALAAAAVWLPKLLRRSPSTPPAPPAPPVEQDYSLEVDYEKVLADTGNIFRYHLRIDPNRTIAVQIDDLANDRHVRKEARMDAPYVEAFARSLLESGFFSLQADYQGIQPGVFNQWDLSITVGTRTHRTRVLNRVEPEIFKNVCAKLEECGKNELGLWAIQFSPDKLVEMARNAYLLGKKLYDEREVRYGNLAASLKSFTEAEWYLETVEPKPDFYAEAVTFIGDCKRMLDERYENQNFRAERAIRLRDWEAAARELRILCEILPDRTDPRHEDARKKLLEIENRMKLGRS
jgi:hypothetical protein